MLCKFEITLRVTINGRNKLAYGIKFDPII